MGLALDFELAATHHALRAATGLDDRLWLGIELSPAAMADPRAHELVAASASPARNGEGTGIVVHLPAVRLAADLHGRPDPPSGQATVGPAFTRELAASRRWRLRARRIITTAHRHGLRVVGEGVETPDDLRRWEQLGADAARGLLLAAPSTLPTALTAGPITARSGARAQTPAISHALWQRTACGQVDRATAGV